MTQKEQTRLQVLNSLLAEHMALDQAATLMGVTTRHTRRILAAYREKGVAAVAHGHRGRRPANATSDAVVAGVVRLARTRYAGANHTHLSELLSEREGIDIGRTTLQRILLNAGLSSPRRRRPPKHRVRRQRMPREGMLIQLDGSYHRWLGEDGPQFTILIAVDDATSCVVNALFCEHEDANSYFLLMQGLLRRCGIPLALYTDRHGVFRHTPGSGLPGMPTQFSRAMEELGIQMIFALSPQAKGRVERTAGTFQDRLVTELRLAGAGSIWEANRVLEQFLPRFNQRFGVPPQHAESAFRVSQPGAVPGTDPVLQASEESGQGQHGEVPAAHPPVAARDGTLQLCRGGRGDPGRTGRPVVGAAVKDGSSLPKRRHPVRYFSETATGFPQLFLSPPPAPTAWANVGPRLSNPWTQGQRMSRIKGPSTAALPQPASPKPPPRASRRSFRGRDRKAIQKARGKGMSLRAIERELGIHRATIKKYMDTESPPTRQSRARARDVIT